MTRLRRQLPTMSTIYVLCRCLQRLFERKPVKLGPGCSLAQRILASVGAAGSSGLPVSSEVESAGGDGSTGGGDSSVRGDLLHGGAAPPPLMGEACPSLSASAADDADHERAMALVGLSGATQQQGVASPAQFGTAPASSLGGDQQEATAELVRRLSGLRILVRARSQPQSHAAVTSC